MKLEHLRHPLDERRTGTMPKHTEPQANGELRRLLDRMLPAYKITAENTQQIVGNPGLQPDILITAPGRAPVVIEAEFMQAYSAEHEAKDRLGLEVVGAARHIDAAIAGWMGLGWWCRWYVPM